MTGTAAEILLVEDSANDVELALVALADLAQKVFVASDGAEALNYAFAPKTPALQVILLDLHLPHMSGLEVLRRLKSDDRTKAIPVVMLTSSDAEQDIREAYRRGVNSYVVKPLKFDDFVKALAKMGHYWAALNRTAPRTSLQQGKETNEAKRIANATDGDR